MGETVAVVGAGNGGCAMAAVLASRGHEVRLTNRSSERLQPIIARGGIELRGVEGDTFVALDTVTGDIDAAISGASVVMLTVPSSALRVLAPIVAAAIRDGQLVIMSPGQTGGALFMAAALRAAGRDCEVCETATLPYACRMHAPAGITIFGKASKLLFAAFPATRTDRLLSRVRGLIPAVVPAANVLETGLQNLNAVEHPAQIVCNAGRVEQAGGDFYFYYEGTTPSVARVIEAVDRERRAIAAAAGVEARPFVDDFFDLGMTTEEARASGSVYAAMQASEGNRWIKAPTTLEHRYIHEDVAWGLVPWMEFAALLGVPTPTMSALTVLAGALNGVDYRHNGLTLEAMGLGGLGDAADLVRFVESGDRHVPVGAQP